MILAGAALDGAIRTEFIETYKSEYEVMEAELRDMARLGIPSDKIRERYMYFESAPHPQRVDRDREVTFHDILPKDWRVANHSFKTGIEMHEDDVADDQTGGALVEQAAKAGENFALLPERLFYQILLGTTDTELLPTVPNAPDGAAMFSATDGGGGDRFGVSGGNLISGSGVATAAAIVANFFSAMSRISKYEDTKGQPLVHRSKLKKFAVWFNSSNLEVFSEAFKALQRPKVVLDTVHGGSEDVAASISNLVRDAEFEVKLYPTPRITDNDWFIRPIQLRHHSLFEQSRSPIREMKGDVSNSDKARETGREYMIWKERRGCGLGLPYDWCKVNN